MAEYEKVESRGSAEFSSSRGQRKVEARGSAEFSSSSARTRAGNPRPLKEDEGVGDPLAPLTLGQGPSDELFLVNTTVFPESYSFKHSWDATVFSSNSVYLAPNSRFYADLTTDTETSVSGYNQTDGTEVTGLSIDHYVYIELTLDDELAITNPTLGSGTLAGLDGNFFTLAGQTPDFASKQYIPLLKVISNGVGGIGVQNMVRGDVRLGLVALDGTLLYHPFAS